MDTTTKRERPERIRCPECGWVQTALVRFDEGQPFPDYVHTCACCGYVIQESEWERVAVMNGSSMDVNTINTLRRLAAAADVYAADQANAKDPRCGLVQPVTVEQAEELNGALAQAFKILDRKNKPCYTPCRGPANNAYVWG